MSRLAKKFKGLDENTKKSIIIFSTIVLIILIVVSVVFKGRGDNYNKIKEDSSNYIVYTKFQRADTLYTVEIPYLNIKGTAVHEANLDIDNFVNSFESNSGKYVLTYRYDINGIILSLVLELVDYNTEYAPETYFKSYNINLDTLEVIEDEALLSFFQIDEETISSVIENQLRIYHQDLVSEGFYHEDECNYECFLRHRGIENYTDNLSYYVKDGNLIAYKPFTFYSIFGEEDYFKDKNYEFVLVKANKN